MDHKAEFELLVLKTFGTSEAEKIDWSAPRLLCIARDFTRYDQYAVQQINRNIELIRYQLFGDDLLLLELINATTASENTSSKPTSTEKLSSNNSKDKTHAERLNDAPQPLKDLYDELREYMLSLGDDVQEKILKLYVAFKRIKNFASVVVQSGHSQGLKVYLKLDPEKIALEEGFSRSVKGVGHWGTGDLEIIIKQIEDLEKAKPLIEQSFEQN